MFRVYKYKDNSHTSLSYSVSVVPPTILQLIYLQCTILDNNAARKITAFHYKSQTATGQLFLPCPDDHLYNKNFVLPCRAYKMTVRHHQKNSYLVKSVLVILIFNVKGSILFLYSLIIMNTYT